MGAGVRTPHPSGAEGPCRRVLGVVVGHGRPDECTHHCHPNFSQQEEHFGAQVWRSRKGAIEATPGKPGVIPGSMGTASYVIAGKGNPMSLNSAPHGAGRNYSRTAARKTFTRAQLREA